MLSCRRLTSDANCVMPATPAASCGARESAKAAQGVLGGFRGPAPVCIGARVIHLAEPVAASLARYLSWRAAIYQGPSTYLLVSRQGRLHVLPVSAVWFTEDLLDGVAIHSLRQSAIQQLVQALGCDGLQVAA